MIQEAALIIDHFSFCLQSVEQTCTYCTAQGICFPRVSLSEEERKNHKECYIFEDEDNPNAPIVLHFPLVNDTFRIYKEPGKYFYFRATAAHCAFECFVLKERKRYQFRSNLFILGFIIYKHI